MPRTETVPFARCCEPTACKRASFPWTWKRIWSPVSNRIGDDRIVISTDYPHADSHWPNAINHLMAVEGLSESSRRKTLWDNCARLYGATEVPLKKG
jgi:predicted TIM-barrel fold metal-dependent hydrolase